MKLTAKEPEELADFLRTALGRIEDAVALIDDAAEKQSRIEYACDGGKRPLKDDIGEPIMGSK